MELCYELEIRKGCKRQSFPNLCMSMSEFRLQVQLPEYTSYILNKLE